MGKRDLKADLELCNKATPGQWVICDWDTDVCGGIIAPDTQEVVIEAEDWDMPVKVKREDAEFMCQAREGWPHAIERALEAEALAQKLLDVLGRVIPRYLVGRLELDLDSVLEANGLLKRAEEVPGDE